MKDLHAYLTENITNEASSTSEFADAIWNEILNAYIGWLEETLNKFSVPKSWIEWNEKHGTGKLDNKDIKEVESTCLEFIQLVLLDLKSGKADTNEVRIKNDIATKKTVFKPWTLTNWIAYGWDEDLRRASVNVIEIVKRFYNAVHNRAHDDDKNYRIIPLTRPIHIWMRETLQKKSVEFSFGRLMIRPDADQFGLRVDITYTPSKESRESSTLKPVDIFGTQVEVGDLIAYSHGSIDTVMTGIVAAAGNVVKVGRNIVPYGKCIVLVHGGKSIDFTQVTK